MPRRSSRSGNQGELVNDFRHEEARRKNNPPAGIGSTFEPVHRQTTHYSYDPHLDPQLVWAGKAEHTSFEVDVVSLHIHERISTRAILEAVKRPEPQLSLFGETPLRADQEIQFYQHDVNWANRLILGDSLLVMNSLLVKEGMAGKVQMIYMDPPYGIRYASNFQPRIDRRDVKDRDEDLTHEPEAIKAYRDTWKLGIHSYLTYLRDRLLLCRELLNESGSIFFQINDENLHLVRCLLDEVFGHENFVAIIGFSKTTGFSARLLSCITDHIVWYARDIARAKYRSLFLQKEPGSEGATKYKPLSKFSAALGSDLPCDALATLDQLTSQGGTSGPQQFKFKGRVWEPPRGLHWKTTLDGLQRLAQAERIVVEGNSLRYIRLLQDYPVFPLTDVWADVGGIQSRTEGKLYAVQTATLAIERCILMTTDPGDLVFDPTCGSGTTPYCAEKWGRRWITCDTSRVALAIARQRLMTAKFDYYELREPERGPAGGFIYETVPHITLESIAKNTEIDVIAAKYQPQIEQALLSLNEALGRDWKEWEVPRQVPDPVWPDEAQEAYRRLWEHKNADVPAPEGESSRLLELFYRLTGHCWESLADVPEPVPPRDWPQAAKEALRRFWELKRAKRREIDDSIQKNAPQETLYDRPLIKRGVVRVSGPFTVEAIPLPAMEDPSQSPIPQYEAAELQGQVGDRAGDHITNMLNLLKRQGSILFPGGRKLQLQNLRPATLGLLHAEAEAAQNGKTVRVAISFGPQYGPVTAFQVREAIQTAQLNAYQILVFAGFSFDPEAQALIQRAPTGALQIHLCHISPDVLVGDLLRTTRASQIFTVFGQPDIKVKARADGNHVVELQGVDIYNPLTGEVEHARGEDVAAWFLDTDYDGKTFHICQAFFPGDPDAWDKLQRALRAQIDPEIFEQMQGTVSFPFTLGQYERIAVKVIDFRGNEVMRVMELGGSSKGRKP